MSRSGTFAWVLFAMAVAGLAVSVSLGLESGESLVDAALFSIGVAFFTLVGAAIVWRQPANRIGWLFAAIGILWNTGDAAARYSTYVYRGGAGETLLVRLGAWYGEWFWFVFLMLTFSLLPQLFPTGRPMNERWARIARAIFAFVVVMTALAMLEDELDLLAGSRVVGTVRNPWGIPGLHDIEEGPISTVLVAGVLASAIAGISSVIVRFRRSRGEERQQLKWFTFAVGLLVAQFALQSLLEADGSGHRMPWLDGIALALVPLAAAVAIFRYRLYDIDVVINRALVYGALTAVLGATYLGIVVVLQRALTPLTADSDVAVAGSTLAVAALFRPVRSRVQGFIDRRFYRHKYDAAETLEEFATSLRDEVDLDSLSAQLVSVVGHTMRPAHASLWLRSSS